jgi:eukaryotic-like serine/threonine-protein kinase
MLRSNFVSHPSQDPATHPRVPPRMGRFEVIREIGEGGMATVYEALDPSLGRHVALKLVRADKRDDSYEHERLIREAKAIADIEHPNVITVYEVGRCSEGVFIAMEYVRGPTLRTWMRATPRPWGEVTRMLLKVGRGLAAAHARGITHGDFKPANVIIGGDERPRVLDFGLAHCGGTRASRRHESSSSAMSYQSLDGEHSITHTTTIDNEESETILFAGTPAYMAPEQHKGEAPDHGSDQFSFATVLWEALYRQRPFLGRNPFLVSQAIIDDRQTPPPVSRVPAWLHRIVDQGIANKPEDRHESIASMLAAVVFASRVMHGY